MLWMTSRSLARQGLLMDSICRSLLSRGAASVSPGRSLLYCSIVSTSFVGSLFLIVPRRVRCLGRNDARQIQWRFLATLLVSAGSLALYPLLIGSKRGTTLTSTTKDRSTLGEFFRESWISSGRILAHLTLLYAGVFVQNILYVREYLKHRDETIFHFSFWRVYYHLHLRPTVMSLCRPNTCSERWMSLRFLLLAPLTEELVFRGCIVSALAASSMRQGTVILLAPLFFGTAHLHHAASKIQQEEPVTSVLAQTFLQFSYTSLFGMYGSFSYLRTGSILAVTAGHSFCNAMGLPDLSFMKRGSLLYSQRKVLLAIHIASLTGFLLGMNLFLPEDQVVLPKCIF